MTKYFLTVSLLVISFGFGQDLDNYLWKSRVIVLFECGNFDCKFEEQQKLLEKYADELVERDMVVLTPKRKNRLKWYEKYGLKKDFNGLLLIGKDGRLKLWEKYVVEPQVLFALVDSMPMRRAEMKRRQEKPN